MYKKAWSTCKMVVLLIKPIAFVAFPLPSPSSDLKVPIEKGLPHTYRVSWEKSLGVPWLILKSVTLFDSRSSGSSVACYWHHCWSHCAFPDYLYRRKKGEEQKKRYESDFQLLTAILCFHSHGQHLCKFIGTKESVYTRKEFNSHRTGLVYKHGHLEVMWKRTIYRCNVLVPALSECQHQNSNFVVPFQLRFLKIRRIHLSPPC